MTDYFSREIYKTDFYIECKINDMFGCSFYENVRCNIELLSVHYQIKCEEGDEVVKRIRVYERLRESLSGWQLYLKPFIFNEEVALECGLTPLAYKGTDMARVFRTNFYTACNNLCCEVSYSTGDK
jgi:hypothetical protein